MRGALVLRAIAAGGRSQLSFTARCRVPGRRRRARRRLPPGDAATACSPHVCNYLHPSKSSLLLASPAQARNLAP